MTDIESDEKGFIPSTPDELEGLPVPGANPAAGLDPSSFGSNLEAAEEAFDQPAVITKHQTIMHLAADERREAHVRYDQLGDDEGSELLESLFLTTDMFEQMGKPLIVTISVRPGDQLN